MTTTVDVDTLDHLFFNLLDEWMYKIGAVTPNEKQYRMRGDSCLYVECIICDSHKSNLITVIGIPVVESLGKPDICL